ncbi:alkaline phosphatase family protein [Planctomicrobium sp. SH668]|uniref:alkaline phosphatase family protein n=1 Tax=Planctomicrobium sp. SH668 TaxID=3448126 RepID=UPI003F5B986B
MMSTSICRYSFSLTAAIVLMSYVVSLRNSELQAAQPEATERTKHVLIFGIDGVRPDSLEKAPTPSIDQLIETGAYTNTAQILGERYQGNDTISGPGWSSILTGVWADKHGVHDNTFKGMNYELFPHFFKHLKLVRPDAFTVSLVSWKPIHDFILSEADLSRVELPPRKPGEANSLLVPASQLDIDTRDGNWHHIAVTRRDGHLRLWLDGKLAGELENVFDAFDLGGDWLYLGRDSREGATQFRGQLDDVRLWNRALSEEELQKNLHASIGSRDGLIAEYTFETTNNGVINETAGLTEGPFDATIINSEPESPSITAAKSTQQIDPTQVLNLPAKSNRGGGARIKLEKPISSVTQGEFTVESRFQTTDTGRNILLGNFADKVPALNLELHNDNTIRVYLQPVSEEAPTEFDGQDEMDRQMAKNAANILQTENPDAMFVYFHQVDSAGHTLGFSPEVPEYVQSIANVDQHIGTVLKSLRSRPNIDHEDWLIIVCTDHGGYLKDHGGGRDIPEIRTVFLVVSGSSAQVGKIEEQVYLVDVATTALMHLTGNVDPRLQLDGKAVGLKVSP